MARPGDPILADHPFTNAADLRHCRLRTNVARVDPELHTPETAAEGAAQHQVLDPAVEAGAAQPRHVISVADLERSAFRIDADEAAHPDQLAAEEDREAAPVRAGSDHVEAAVEMPGVEGRGVNLPDIEILRTGPLQGLTMLLRHRLQADVAIVHFGI